MSRVGVELMRREGSGSVSPTTPKAFANYSPGLLQPWVYVVHHLFNSVGVPLKANTFSVKLFWFLSVPWLEQPWAVISERLRRTVVQTDPLPRSSRRLTDFVNFR